MNASALYREVNDMILGVLVLLVAVVMGVLAWHADNDNWREP